MYNKCLCSKLHKILHTKMGNTFFIFIKKPSFFRCVTVCFVSRLLLRKYCHAVILLPTPRQMALVKLASPAGGGGQLPPRIGKEPEWDLSRQLAVANIIQKPGWSLNMLFARFLKLLSKLSCFWRFKLFLRLFIGYSTPFYNTRRKVTLL